MTQRPDLFQLDCNHPLAKGLVFAGLGFGPGSGAMFDASLYKNHGTLTNMTPSTDWVFVPELGRWGLDFDGSNAYVVVTATDTLKFQPADASFSVALWVLPTTTSAYRALLWIQDTDNDMWRMLLWNDNTLRGSLDTIDCASVGTVAQNTLTHVCVVFDKNGNAQPYINGVASGSGTALNNEVMNITSTILEIGRACSAVTPYHFAGTLADPIIYSRALTPNEIADLADPSNVYLSGLIAGRPRRRYTFLGGGSTVEINATLAALELTGNAAGVSVGTTFTAAAGAIELSGLAASVSSGTDVAATTAACEATGLGAAVSAGTTFTAETGAIAATGLAADVSVGTTLTATIGAMAASGLDATVSTGDSIEATTGAVELSGLSADVSTGTTITGSLATLVAAALAADVSATVSIEATTPAMEWTALPASVSTESSITRQLFFGIKSGGAL